MARTKLNIRFHNPNTEEDTIKHLSELLAQIALAKVLAAQKKQYIF